MFGSYTKGTPREDSDIDIAVISSAFKGDRYLDRRRIVPLRRGIDSRIEPIPFTPGDYADGGMLIDEIKSTGQEILKSGNSIPEKVISNSNVSSKLPSRLSA